MTIGKLLVDVVKGLLQRYWVSDISRDADGFATCFLDVCDSTLIALWATGEENNGIFLGKA